MKIGALQLCCPVKLTDPTVPNPHRAVLTDILGDGASR
jgi:hypothetical protein